ncbi:hypothetical protein V2J09_011157 [Rumex salicifolius]
MASSISCASSAASKSAKLKLAIGSVGHVEEAYRPFPDLVQGGDDAIRVLICQSWDAKNPSGRYLGTEYIFNDERDNIDMCKLDCSQLGFVQEAFHLKDIEDIAFKGNKYLIDVLGRELRPTRNGSHYLEFHLINERGRSIKVILWGALAEEVINRCGAPDELYVIVLSAVKVKEYRSGILLSNTSRTMLFDSHDIPETANLRQLMGNGVVLPQENNGTLSQLLQLGREQSGQNNVVSIPSFYNEGSIFSIEVVCSLGPWLCISSVCSCL